MNKAQQRVVLVLKRIVEMCEDDTDNASMFADALDVMLRDLHSDDAFGTEGECDPRGDFRNRRWSMKKVEGIDG